MNVVIAGGGTAGHVSPAIALARALTEQPGREAADRVIFVGTTKGVEASLVPVAGFKLETVEVAGFDRARPQSLPGTGLRAARAVAQARRILVKCSADVVVGMGGYVSLPACLAARGIGVPVVLHEQNIVFGLANRVCKPLAGRVAVSFEATLSKAGPKGVFTGNPVMPEMSHFDPAESRSQGLARFGLDPGRRTLLVFGGSQGALTVNEAAAGLAAVWRASADIQVVHVTGRAAFRDISDAVDRHLASSADGGGLIYRVVEYVDRMVEAYAVADLALCRGGASTVAELACVGLPSIIVPYPHHRDRQQERHAGVLGAAGAAVVVPDACCSTARIAGEVERLLADDEALSGMGMAASVLGRPDAASRLAEIVRGEAAPLPRGPAEAAPPPPNGPAEAAPPPPNGPAEAAP